MPYDPKCTYNAVPSVATVADAGLPSVRCTSSIRRGVTDRRHASRPVAASNASVTNASPSCAVTKTLPSRTTGDEWPLGSATDQSSFVPGPNRVGGRASEAATPVRPGPRKPEPTGCGAAAGPSAP